MSSIAVAQSKDSLSVAGLYGSTTIPSKEAILGPSSFKLQEFEANSVFSLIFLLSVASSWESLDKFRQKEVGLCHYGYVLC